jgi:hypothetical protein
MDPSAKVPTQSQGRIKRKAAPDTLFRQIQLATDQSKNKQCQHADCVVDARLTTIWRARTPYETFMRRNAYVVMACCEHWIETLRCPNCGLAGVARLSLSEKIITVDVSDGFEAVFSQFGDTFFCRGCKRPATEILMAPLSLGERRDWHARYVTFCAWSQLGAACSSQGRPPRVRCRRSDTRDH